MKLTIFVVFIVGVFAPNSLHAASVSSASTTVSEVCATAKALKEPLQILQKSISAIISATEATSKDVVTEPCTAFEEFITNSATVLETFVQSAQTKGLASADFVTFANEKLFPVLENIVLKPAEFTCSINEKTLAALETAEESINTLILSIEAIDNLTIEACDIYDGLKDVSSNLANVLADLIEGDGENIASSLTSELEKGVTSGFGGLIEKLYK